VFVLMVLIKNNYYVHFYFCIVLISSYSIIKNNSSYIYCIMFIIDVIFFILFQVSSMPGRGSILGSSSIRTTSSRSNDPLSGLNSQASILINLFIMSCMIAIIRLWVHTMLNKIMRGGMIINHMRVFTFKIYFKLKKVSF